MLPVGASSVGGVVTWSKEGGFGEERERSAVSSEQLELSGGGMVMVMCCLLRSTPVFLAHRWSCSNEYPLLHGKAASIGSPIEDSGFCVPRSDQLSAGLDWFYFRIGFGLVFWLGLSNWIGS
ncbi:unnamed protein product [Arabidopsis arenosa]|uniref:Uncharacterized protein n=1 Tax=Arabidopsis arenosa TaxID=38785 RepID=A0A8S2ACY0_ARAAE|nr:unnamed protein product [Arabidopsis arenosa]